MILTGVAALELTHRVEALQDEGAKTGLVEVILGHFDAGDGAKDLAFHLDVSDVALFTQRRDFPRRRPRADAEHVVEFLAGDNPLQTLHLVDVGRRVVTDRIDGIRTSPELLADALLHIDRQTAAGEVDVAVAHWIAVIERIEHAADLTVVFVGMVLGMAVRPVKRIVILLPDRFGKTKVFENLRRGFTEPAAEFAFAVSNARENVLKRAGIGIFKLVPRNLLVLFFGEVLLPIPLLEEVDEVTVQLTVVAPDAEVVERLRAYEAGFTRHGLLEVVDEAREEPAAPERETGLFGDRVNLIFGSRFFVAND